ncbi:MAG: hypothetical protein GEU73_05010 [Chloroflexi bacterium]|nr:hypothetical protein [Chloroflexota bacterium]
MKALTIHVIIKSTKDHETAKTLATKLLESNGYRNVLIEQTRDFDGDTEAISVYAVADHDLKRPPRILRTIRAAVLVEPEKTEATS